MSKSLFLGVLLATAASLGAQPARVDLSGTGCVAGAASFYELFPQATFDLSGSPTNSILMNYLVTGYLVTPGTNNFIQPTGGGLGLVDDSISPPQALGFTLPFPGGSTTDVRICSNGFIYLNSTGNSTSYTPNVSDVLSGGPRVFPAWSDWLPDGAANISNVFFETGVGFARATWMNVREYAASGSTTMQCTFFASGDIEFAWQTVSTVSHQVLVGFSPGTASRDPGNRDISTTLPFATQPDTTPLTQGADRPVMGTSINLRVSSIPLNSLMGVEFIGPLLSPGLDLTFLGMPGCSSYINPQLVTIPFATPSATATIGPLLLPNRPGLIGFQLSVQALTVSPGINARDVAASNAATLVFGTF